MTLRFRGKRATLLCALALCVSAPTRAEDAPAAAPSEEIRNKARTSFGKGSDALKKRRYAEAITHFEAANALIPHPLTSFNLGYAHVQLEQWLEAEAALSTFLDSGKDAGKRPEAQALYERVLEHVGVVSVTTTPPGATVRVGANEVQTPGKFAALPGKYRMFIELEGHDPVIRSIEVSVGRSPMEVELHPLVAASGSIRLTCALSAVHVHLDQEEVEAAGMDTVLRRPVGNYEARFTRPGYEPSVHPVMVLEGATASAVCDMVPQKNPDPSTVGWIEVVNSQGGRLEVDGREAPLRSLVPVGPHSLTLEKNGFETWRQDVNVMPRETTSLSVQLDPIGGSADAGGTREMWAWITGISGLVAVGVGTGLYVAADSEYSNWQSEQARLDGLWEAAGPGDLDALRAQQSTNDGRVDTINALDGAAVGLFIGGGVLIGTSAILWLTGGDPEDAPTAVHIGPNGASAAFRF